MLRVMLTEGNYHSSLLVLWKKKKKDGACHKILLLEDICKSFHAIIPLNCADIPFSWLSLLASKPCMKIHSQEVRQRDTDRKGEVIPDEIRFTEGNTLFHSHVSCEVEVRNHHVVQAWKKENEYSECSTGNNQLKKANQNDQYNQNFFLALFHINTGWRVAKLGLSCFMRITQWHFGGAYILLWEHFQLLFSPLFKLFFCSLCFSTFSYDESSRGSMNLEVLSCGERREGGTYLSIVINHSKWLI